MNPSEQMRKKVNLSNFFYLSVTHPSEQAKDLQMSGIVKFFERDRTEEDLRVFSHIWTVKFSCYTAI
jgi:hypothetical protein